MATVEKFEDLKIWQKARELAHQIFKLIVANSELRDFDYKNQINRSSASIMDNIAEGFGRQGNKEFKNFLSIAKGSCEEVKSQLYRGLDRNYFGQEEYKALYDEYVILGQMISGFIKYLRNSDLKGAKYRLEEPVYTYSEFNIEH